MKSLLRSSIVALIVFAGYAALATDINKPRANSTMPRPLCTPSVGFAGPGGPACPAIK